MEDQDHKEILAYHWHPETTETQFPHFHVRQGADWLRSVHLPSGRIAFEEFCQLLIDEIGVTPERKDAKKVLEANLALFKKHKTW